MFELQRVRLFPPPLLFTHPHCRVRNDFLYPFYNSFILLLFDASEISERESSKKPALIYIQYRNPASIWYSVMQITWV